MRASGPLRQPATVLPETGAGGQIGKLRWLHLSDIHFWRKNDWKDDAARRKLLDLLKTRFKDGSLPTPDLVFCTGDIAQGETRPDELALQYQSAQSFFAEVLEVCGLAKDRLFVVPGNHDVNRRKVSPKFQKGLLDAGLAEIEADWADANDDYQRAMERMAEYGQFVETYLSHQAAAAMDKHPRHCYAKVITINQLRVGIGGFNSAWTCYDDKDQNRLWMAAEWQFNAADGVFSGQTDLRIGLMHHPASWFRHEEASLAKQRIRAGFDFWLHGHEHDAWVTPTDREIVISAGAVNAGSDAEFGINLVDLDLAAGNGRVHLFAYQAGGNVWLVKNGEDAQTGVREIAFGKRVVAQPAQLPLPSALPKEAKIPLELLAWCDRHKFINHLDAHLQQSQPPIATLFCVADHVKNRTRILMQRISKELADSRRSAKKIKSNQLVHIQKVWDCETAEHVGSAICDEIQVNDEAELLQKLAAQNLAVHLICAYLNCSNRSDEQIRNALKAVSNWVDEVNRLADTQCKLVLILVLQYGDGETTQPVGWWKRMINRVSQDKKIQAVYEQARKKGGLTPSRIDELLTLQFYDEHDFRMWIELSIVKQTLGSVAEAWANENFIADLFQGGRKKYSLTQLQAILEQLKH